MKVLSEEPITNEQAYKILKEVKVESYRSERTMKYLERIGFIENSGELLEKLLNLGISKEKAIMIINTMPKTTDELRAILEGDYTPELGKQILELLKEYYK